MEILVRFNHNGKNDAERWRLLWDGKEFICTSVRFECGTETVRKPVWANGESVTKWHIQPIEPKKVIFNIKDQETHVTIL